MGHQPQARRGSHFHRFSCLVLVACLAIAACTPTGGGGGGGNGGGLGGGDNGNDDGGGGDGGGTGGGPVEVDDSPFVDSGAPPFEGSDDVTQFLYGSLDGAPGRVVLPDGVDISLSQLRVVNSLTETAIAADGTFTPTVPGFATFLSSVVNASGRIMLLGYTQTPGGTPPDISAESTAAVLLYFALGGPALPERTDRDTLRSEIRFDFPEITGALVAEIEEAMRRNPTAIGDRDASIVSALRAAKADYFTAAAQTELKSVTRKGIGTRQQDGTGPLAGYLTTQPSTYVRQSGVLLRTDDAADGLTALNQFRRRGMLYVYLSGYETASGERVDVSPVQLVHGPLDIIAAGSPSQSSGFGPTLSVSLAAMGGSAWTPVESAEILLLGQDEAAATFFDVVLIGAALDQTETPEFFLEPRFSDARVTWVNPQIDLQWKTFILDFFLPAMEELAFGLSQPVPPSTEADAVTAFRGLIEPLLSANSITITTTAGFEAALELCSNEMRTNATFRNDFLSIVRRTYGALNDFFDYNFLSQSFVNLLSSMAGVAIDEIIDEALDVGTFLPHIQQSHEGDLWEVTLSGVRLLPSEPIVSMGSPIATLGASTAGSVDRVLCYNWSTNGARGFLKERTGFQTGMSFTSAEAGIDYEALPNGLVDGDMDTVSVTVFDITDVSGATSDCTGSTGAGVFLGSAEVTVRGDLSTGSCDTLDLTPYQVDGGFTLSVSPRRVRPGDFVTVTITAPGGSNLSVYLPLACHTCPNGVSLPDINPAYEECSCGPTNELLYNFGDTPVYNASQAQFALLGGDPANELWVLRPACAWMLNLIFSAPDGSNEPVTQSVSYRVSNDWAPCPIDNPRCSCPYLGYAFDDSTNELAWRGHFVIVRGGVFSSGGFAAEVLELATDINYDRFTFDPCEND